MYAFEGNAENEPVTLSVVDVERSRGFYQDLFGLVPHESNPRALRLPAGVTDGGAAPEIRLEDAGGDGGDGGEPRWLSVEVASVTEVLDLYLLAIMIGARASLPRKRGERWNTVVTDPDGNKISIWTVVPRGWDSGREADAPAPGRRSPRWEWERSQRPGYDAGRRADEQSSEEDRRTRGRRETEGRPSAEMRGERAPARAGAHGQKGV